MIIGQEKIYKLPELPIIKSDQFLLTDGRTGYTGSIIRRGVKNSLGVYYHYGIVYGVDKSGTFWVIENNVGGIVCISLKTFLHGLPYAIYYVNLINNHSIIMQRAMERVNVPYEALDNNCEHFVNYSVFGKLESIQVKRTEVLADVIVSSLEIYARLNPQYNGILPIYSGLREHLKLPRMKELDHALEKMGAHHAIQNIKVLEELLMKYPQVTSKAKNQQVTYYKNAKRFLIVDREKMHLIVRLNPASLHSKNLTALSFKKIEWVIVEIAKVNHQLCVSLIKESHDFISTSRKKKIHSHLPKKLL